MNAILSSDKPSRFRVSHAACPSHRWLVAAVAACWLFAGTALAEVRALVIGIDEYRHSTSLKGAVNDARDISGRLRQLGVDDLTLLLNAEATRDRITQSWQGIVARAGKGDTLVMSYAGHGSQEPERVSGNEEDGKDEVLLLGSFEESGPGSRERIIDDELNQWFQDAGARGLEVVFVADACHSGTLTRSIDPRAGEATVRYADYVIEEDMLSLDLPAEAANMTEDSLPHVTFLAAGQETQKVPEIELSDTAGRRTMRGALSWVFARALEGQGDPDGDGRLTRGELNRFVRENVRVLAEGRQTPNLLPKDAGERVVLPIPRTAGAPAAPIPMPTLPEVRLRITGLKDSSVSSLAEGLVNVALVSRAEGADLVYDTETKQVVSGQGDILATALNRESLQGVVDKWGGLELLKVNGMGDRLKMRVIPDDTTHRKGKEIGFLIDDVAMPHLVIFSLSGDGTVHFHYPVPGDPTSVSIGQPVRYDFRVTPPFGADHILTLTGDAPMGGLVSALETLDGHRAAKAAVKATLAAMRSGRHQLGIQGLYTAP